MSDNFNELEYLQDEVLSLREQNENLTTERDNLAKANEELTAEIAHVREVNQKYFNRLIAQDETEKKEDPEEEEIPSCEDIAKTLNIF